MQYGISVNKPRRETENRQACSVPVTILTDCELNDSSEYTGAGVKKLNGEFKNKGWTFTYIGAIRAAEQGAFSISISNSLKFEANQADVKGAFDLDKKVR